MRIPVIKGGRFPIPKDQGVEEHPGSFGSHHCKGDDSKDSSNVDESRCLARDLRNMCALLFAVCVLDDDDDLAQPMANF